MRQMQVEVKSNFQNAASDAAYHASRHTPQHSCPPLSNRTIASRQFTRESWKRDKFCVSASIGLLPLNPIRLRSPPFPCGCRSTSLKASGGATRASTGGVVATLPPERIPGASFRHLHTVGILGGSSPSATVEFLRRLVAVTPESDPIPLIMCSDPSNYFATRGLISEAECGDPSYPLINHPVTRVTEPETGWMVHRARRSVTRVVESEGVIDEGSFVAALLDGRRFLEGAGAKCIVMPSHVSHIWYEQVSSEGGVPILSMADSVAKELKAADLSPLEAGNRRPKIGILSSQSILAAGFYQQALNNQGFDVVLLDKATMEHTVIPGIRALRRCDMEGARNLLRIAVQVLLVNAVNVVVLACHDIGTAFSPDDPLLKRCIDPVDSLARATVKWAHAAKGVTQ